MLKAKKGCGIYRDTLQREARDRYLQKMGFINGLDPYEVASKEWCVGEEFLPPFAREDIFSYLVCGVSAYTHEEFRCYKSLEAYKQLTDGKVHDMEVMKLNENTVIRSKVMHSMRQNESPLKPWVILTCEGHVLCAHCTCMAGIAESCTHVGALLFAIEATVRLRGKKTITDVPSYWAVPSAIRKVKGEVAHKIDFTSFQYTVSTHFSVF